MMGDFSHVRQRMNATGIGFAGIDGAWWLPAVEPFPLPATVADDLVQIGQAIFLLFDTVIAMYGAAAGEAGGLTQLLQYKVPAHIPLLMGGGRVEGVRPDFQLQLRSTNAGQRYQLVATELEICPATQGFAHAMQVGYGLRPDLVEHFADYLAGRTLLFAGTHQWSEFLFEQLAFCRALAQFGAKGRVLYDRPIATIADDVRTGTRWQPPMFGIKTKSAGWNDDVLGRLRAQGLAAYLWTPDDAWPEEVGDAVVFRFGYFDCFAPDVLQRLLAWEAQGATMLNPTMFILDSKVIMAALQLPAVREQIRAVDANAMAVLDQCIPETLLLQPELFSRLLNEKDDWVLKFAGFDSGNQAWGGRSLQIGAHHSPEAWRHILHQYTELPWPVVAQQAAPSVQVDIAYSDAQEKIGWLRQGATRLRSFMLRQPASQGDEKTKVFVGGSHITVSGSMQVSESTDAVQAPVVYL
ncbi:MAG: hypothetical protein U0350_33150 [Caldilineaceae bacterium]